MVSWTRTRNRSARVHPTTIDPRCDTIQKRDGRNHPATGRRKITPASEIHRRTARRRNIDRYGDPARSGAFIFHRVAIHGTRDHRLRSRGAPHHSPSPSTLCVPSVSPSLTVSTVSLWDSVSARSFVGGPPERSVIRGLVFTLRLYATKRPLVPRCCRHWNVPVLRVTFTRRLPRGWLVCCWRREREIACIVGEHGGQRFGILDQVRVQGVSGVGTRRSLLFRRVPAGGFGIGPFPFTRQVDQVTLAMLRSPDQVGCRSNVPLAVRFLKVRYCSLYSTKFVKFI